MCASRCYQLNEGVNKLTRRKPFLWQNFIFGKVSSTTRVIYFIFVLWRLTSYFLILKTLYMSLFVRFSFWVPNCFPEVIRPRCGLKFRNQLELLPQIRSQIIVRVESGIISLDSNITDNITRTIIIVEHSD